jgi:uncharacterized protein (TIGR03437 family)
MPVETAIGTALVVVQRDGLSSNTVSVDVAARAPRLLQIGAYGAIVNAMDGSLPMPIGYIPGINTHPAKAGDVLTIYAIGLGATSPASATGQPAPATEPFARLINTPIVTFGDGFSSIAIAPSFAALTPTYAGLYQVNVTIPAIARKTNGVVNVTIQFTDAVTNTVQIAIE